MLLVDIFLDKYIKKSDYQNHEAKFEFAHNLLKNRNGPGSDMLGWINCFENFDCQNIFDFAETIYNKAELIVIIGIGGSYMGTKMALDFLKPVGGPEVCFAGNILDSEYVCDILKKCEDKNTYLIVVSKSGKTLETSVCTEIFVDIIKKKYGAESKNRIIIITDKYKGDLRKQADEFDYKSFEIPSNIGGRFSFFTAASLVPLSLTGVNIKKIIDGALDFKNSRQKNEMSFKYSVIRNILYEKGKKIEILAGFNLRILGFFEWWKQLFGESEGKEGKGIFPASAIFSTDLHSLGQYIQEGSKILFETFIFNENSISDFKLPNGCYGNIRLKNKSMQYLNSKIFEATVLAHSKADIPCFVIKIKEFSEFELGNLILFFEQSCALSAYMLGVNPFNQDGVEKYKNEITNLIN
ncbi:MAG: glucose-6-phosphate isomerase [Candidatus Improbicoccus pseudotrichonymphae]|uniref:Glucose-6-phosphate isomerase n=1 Tax=Candidatus Improbicoccus pseudotrichonymphae TaxID=3033792 RepID=A0AA48IH15_9FIRM|nr:MAG: glucose-6-phosphate isomerase [Candidatus Improbicoccus pseudotrichonymphae]